MTYPNSICTNSTYFAVKLKHREIYSRYSQYNVVSYHVSV